MVNRSVTPTKWFWNFSGFAIAVMSLGMSWSISRTKAFELQIAEYKLKTGNALTKVQKVSDTLSKSAKTLPIATQVQQEINQQLRESNAIIEQAENEIDQEVEKLTDHQSE